MDFQTTFEYASIPSDQTTLGHLLLRLRTPSFAGAGQAQSLALSLAIDKSRSMEGPKLKAVLEAAAALVNWLTRHDYLSVTVYDSRAESILPLTRLNDKESVLSRFSRIQAGNATNLSGGWLQALRFAESAPAQCVVRRVILLTDGLANVGVIEPDLLREIARAHGKRRISTTTIGVGREFSETLLRSLAREGGGNYYFIDGPEDTHEVFFREFGAVTALYAQGAEIRVRPEAGVRIREVLSDLPVQWEGDSLVLRPNDLRSDDVHSIVLLLEVDGKEFRAENGIARAEVSFYNILDGMKLEKREAWATLPSAGDESFHPEVRSEAIVAHAGRAMREAARLSREKDAAAAQEILRVARERISRENDIVQGERLIAELDSMKSALEADSDRAARGFESRAFDPLEEGLPGGREARGEILEISLQGQLDLYRCPELKAEAARGLNSGCRCLLINCSQLTYIDSSGTGTLIQILGWVKRRNGLMVLANVQNSVERIFQLTRLQEYFEIRDSPAEARVFLNEFMGKME